MTAEPTLVLAGRPVLEFQPAVDLATGRLLGFEALIRWDHPTKGHIPPHVLLPWAEANDDIVSLNSWIVSEACNQAQQWPSGIQVAVNCSIVQLRHGEASVAVANALEQSGLNPDRLTVEVTERAIADDKAAQDLRAVSALGVHLAVDDVGTSWSTLQPLRRLQVEIVKIDRAFITSLEAREGMNRAIVEAVIHVSHTLAMSTVAEGVETAQQVAILREFGADVGQGYFFDPPLSTSDARALALADPRPIYDLTGRAPSQPAMARALTVIDEDGSRRAPVAVIDPASDLNPLETAPDADEAVAFVNEGEHPSAAGAERGAKAATARTRRGRGRTTPATGATTGSRAAKAISKAAASPNEAEPTVSLGPDPDPETSDTAASDDEAPDTGPRSPAAAATGSGQARGRTARGAKAKGNQRSGGGNARGGKGRAAQARRGRGSGPRPARAAPARRLRRAESIRPV